MSESLQRIAELPAHPEYFLESDGAGGFVFVDPLSGSPLAETWPSVLDYDRISSVGQAYLEASRHPIHVIGGYHGGIEDFTDIQDQFGELLDSCRVIGLEADWHAPDNLAEAYPNLAIIKPDKSVGRGAFTRAQIDWARQRDKLALPFDLDGPDDPLRQSLRALFADTITLPGFDKAPLTPDQQARLGSICLGAYTAIRHHMMPAQLGFWLQRLEEQISPDEPVAMIVGLFHMPTLADKMNATLDSRVTGHIVQGRTLPTIVDHAQRELFSSMAATSRITADQIASITA